MRLLRSRADLRDEGRAYAYLRTITVNLARSFLRRKALEIRHRLLRDDDIVEIDVAGRLDVLGALARLPYGQRACVILRFYEDLTESDTARVLGVSVGTVKSQTHKALRKLEGLIGGDTSDD